MKGEKKKKTCKYKKKNKYAQHLHECKMTKIYKIYTPPW